MLTYFHAPRSRSSTVLAAIEQFGLRDRLELRLVTIPRVDGSGGRDAGNPHPEGKVPYLEHDGVGFSERAAILAYLSEQFPDSGLGPVPGARERLPFLGWLAYYAGVMEPVMICAAAGISHPYLTAALRGPEELFARLHDTLADGREWLLEGGLSAADILMHSPFDYFPDAAPDDPLIRGWIARCGALPGLAAAKAFDSATLAAAA